MQNSQEVSEATEARAHRRAGLKLAAYVLATVFISSVLLIVNVGVVYTLFAGVAQLVVRESYSQKLGQFILFVGPFLLLFPEWLVYDILVSPSRYKR